MKLPHVKLPRISAGFISAGVLLLVAALAWLLSDQWLPPARAWIAEKTGWFAVPEEEKPEDEHSGHDHGHEEGHDAESALELSEQARRNIGLEVGEVALRPFERSITIPSLVVERPGETTIKVAAPVTGVVTAVYAVPGQSVEEGSPLFKMRLTHEDLVRAQTEFLRTLGQLDVEERELARLEQITSGAVAGKVVLERQYERDKLEAALNAERESLLLHGLSEEQVAAIERDRKLLRELMIDAPVLHADSSLHDDSESEQDHASLAARPVSFQESGTSPATPVQRFVVVELHARKGEVVQSGAPLCVVAEYDELYIEGRAFEQDAEELVRAANENRKVTAVLEGNGDPQTIEGLEFSHVANQVERDSRALHFYVRLPNEILRDAVRPDGRHFHTWRFKPGQRMQVRVPVETWDDMIVLPVDAVAQEGLETFVFVENGDHFHRRPVHVEYRDQLYAVIANDGSLFPGESVAMSSAHQLQMAIKNKGGGGVDPHAGHNH